VTQLTLPLHRATDPDTSRTAAASQTPAKLSAGRLLALHTLAEHGPLTDFEHEAISGLVQTSAGKRRLELLRRGLVEYGQERRDSPNGSPARVWRITEAGYRQHIEWAGER
jgi:hypothetical protein